MQLSLYMCHAVSCCFRFLCGLGRLCTELYSPMYNIAAHMYTTSSKSKSFLNRANETVFLVYILVCYVAGSTALLSLVLLCFSWY